MGHDFNKIIISNLYISQFKIFWRPAYKCQFFIRDISDEKLNSSSLKQSLINKVSIVPIYKDQPVTCVILATADTIQHSYMKDVTRKHGLLTKCEVMMAGYWPSYFFVCFWTDTDGFIIWLLGKFFLRDKAGSPERARWLHLTHSDSQSQCRICFILPTCRASHIISRLIEHQCYLSVSFAGQWRLTLVTEMCLNQADVGSKIFFQSLIRYLKKTLFFYWNFLHRDLLRLVDQTYSSSLWCAELELTLAVSFSCSVTSGFLTRPINKIALEVLW